MPKSSLSTGDDTQLLILVRIAKIHPAEHSRLCDHDASSVSSEQPVFLRRAGQRLDDAFDHSGVAAVGDAVASMDLLACVIPLRHVALKDTRPNRHTGH